MGYNPDCWGPTWWYFLYKYSAFLPDNLTKEESDDVNNMLFYIFKTLPCANCSHHAMNHHNSNKITFKSGREVFNWIREMHNQVSMRIGKEKLNINADKHYYMYRTCHKFNHEKNSLELENSKPEPIQTEVKKVYVKRPEKNQIYKNMDMGILLLVGGLLIYCK